MSMIQELAKQLIEDAEDQLVEAVEATAELRVAEGADLTADLMETVEKEWLLKLLAEMTKQINER